MSVEIIKMTMTETFDDRLKKFITDETDRRVQDALTRFAETIATVHRIPLSLLLRDMPSLQPGLGTCIGSKKNGARCTHLGKYEGYCMSHYDQRRKVQPIKIVQEGPVHTHGLPPFFKDDCPACIASSAPRKKLIIDCNVLF